VRGKDLREEGGAGKVSLCLECGESGMLGFTFLDSMSPWLWRLKGCQFDEVVLPLGKSFLQDLFELLRFRIVCEWREAPNWGG